MKDNLRLYGLWAVCGASLVLIVASAFQSWKRPVSAISSIAPYSDTVDASTGRVLHTPGGPYRSVDLHRGDRIVRYDGRTWLEAQRLNWHELTERRPGDKIQLLVQRGAEQRSVVLPVRVPNWWEQVVLSRYAISAFICWLPSSLILLTMMRNVRRQPADRDTLLVDQSSIPLWFLGWVSIAQSMGSLKYPVAVMWTEALIPVIGVLMSIVSLPYPLAPRYLRSRLLEYTLVALAIGAAVAGIIHALQSPFPSADWRRMAQLLRPNDLVWNGMYGIASLGVLVALFGIIMTASSEWLTKKLRWLAHHSPSPVADWLQRLASRIERLYQQCPTSIKVMSQFQSMILLIYLVFDMLPRLQGEAGGGYSVLFATIPLSYLLLYGDIEAQNQGRRGIWGIAAGVAIIHIFDGSARLISGNYGTGGANWADLSSLLLVALGTIGGGMGIAIHQLLRGRESPLTIAIDGLFHQTNEEDFWTHMTQVVGACVGVSTWLWVKWQDDSEWQITRQSGPAREAWLDAPAMQEGLVKLFALRPVSVIVDTLELPTTLILLPIVRNQRVVEVLVAANPQKPTANRLLEINVAGRLREAVNLLRVREQEQERALEQARYADAMRQLQEWEKRTSRSDYTHAYALLHDGPLHQMSGLAEAMRTILKRMEAPQDQAVNTWVGELESINQDTRRIFQNLGAYIVVERLLQTIQERVDEWEQEFPDIAFLYDVAEEPSLSQEERDRLYLVIKQAVENAIQHARPQTIRIMIRQDVSGLRVEVYDDGIGFVYDEDRVRRGDGGYRSQTGRLSSGIFIMHKLIEEIGGTFAVETAPGQGCRVRVEMV